LRLEAACGYENVTVVLRAQADVKTKRLLTSFSSGQQPLVFGGGLSVIRQQGLPPN
jgi:hypothetical protein